MWEQQQEKLKQGGKLGSGEWWRCGARKKKEVLVDSGPYGGRRKRSYGMRDVAIRAAMVAAVAL